MAARDVDRYPQVLDTSTDVWHRRPDTDGGGGPSYPTVCGRTVTTHTVDEPEGVPEGWQTRCREGCFA